MLVALALIWQGLLAQAHMHLGADLAMALSQKADRARLGGRHAVVVSRADPGAVPGAPDDDEATCPICQVFHASGACTVPVHAFVAAPPVPATPVPIPDAKACGATRRLSVQPRAPPLA
ncbi:MAG TPA: DUF2946 family protein [Candidatus Sulfotelmatobacter sp.]|nr:DUF2946 family protein [Candidatus Sulfotelmatobacter sp.]